MSNDEDLRKVFKRYETLLFKAANSVKEENVYSFKTEFAKKTDEATRSFKQRLKRYIDKAIPETAVSSAARTALENAGVFYEASNVKYTAYVQMVSKLTASADQFKDSIQARIDQDESKGITTTITDLKQYIIEELKSGVGITVRYSNGTKMPVDKYAAMLARTARTETNNLVMVCKAVDDGNDLVECSTVSPTCDVCAMYQGRIYSVSGNTPGYPSLYQTAFKNGYSIIHPNCRHRFYPYNPRFHTADERARLEENTKKPFTEGGQSETLRTAYAKSQTQMRAWNKEMNEFAEMQKFYAGRKEDMPYKNLGSFRRAYRSEKGTLAYAKSHYARRDLQQYEEFQSVLGKENMPQTLAEFQEIKYNKSKSIFELLDREKTTISDINNKNWEAEFKKRAVETYYEFRESNIELTDHGVARLLQRKFKKEDIKAICSNKKFNYLQSDGKRIKFYNNIAVVYAKDIDEVVTVLSRPKAKEEWDEISYTDNV